MIQRGQFSVRGEGGGNCSGYAVFNQAGDMVAGPFETHREAWRWIDLQQCEPISKTQERHQWAFEKAAGGKGL